MYEKPAETSVPIHELLARRWSGRAFDPELPVDREQIVSLCEAARWAPSCYGEEPWRYIIWDKNTDEESWQRAFNCLGEFNQAWVKNAPVLMVSIADTIFKRNKKPNRYGQYDTGASAISILLQAISLGLMAHEMGGFDKDKLREEFGIPERYDVMAMIAVGHPTDPEILEGQLKKTELAPRQRMPLSENFFDREWGNPLLTGE
jgi:nitroreductase